MNARARRHEHIRHLLTTSPIASQDRLRDLLSERGLAVGQPTLSRDLREIGVIKTPEGYRLPDPAAAPTAPTTPPAGSALATYVIAAERGGTMLVLRTGPGHAQPVALELDRSPPKGVLGTIAGDDTVFIATRSEAAAKQTLATLKALASLA